MKDVARLAGVSTSTVSHVINKDRFVSESVTDKVEAAIKALNYAPSALARSLKLNQTRTIGMLITASTNPFYSELVRGVERSCFERGYSLVLCNTEGDEQRMNRNLETLMQKRVDGLLLLCTETHQPSREIMQRYPSIPTVMMDWSPSEYSRLRLQLAEDKTRPDATDRQVWLQYIMSLGAHGAHRF